MEQFLLQTIDVTSGYGKKYIFELSVLGVILVMFYRAFVPFEQGGYLLAMMTMIGLVLWYKMYNYNHKSIDTNKAIEYKLERIQSQMYIYVDSRMRRIRFSDTNNLLSKTIYKENLDRVKLDYLYTDARLVKYIFELIFMYPYNTDSWGSMVIGINGILKIRAQLELFYKSNGYYPENVVYQAESADELLKKVLNFTHTFIYTLPKSNDVESIVEKTIKKMHLLLKGHVRTVKKMTVKNNIIQGINRTTKFTELRDNIAIASNSNDDPRFELYV